MKTIAIISQKGGSGKTTLALHLAVAATEAEQTAVILDLDPQASATVWHKARIAAGHGDTPHVQATHSAALGDTLAACRKQDVDLVLIDTAPQSDRVAIEAAQAADLVLITCKPSVMDLRAVQNTIRLAEIAGVKPHVVLTQVEAFGSLADEADRTLRGLGVNVLTAGMGRRVAYHHGLIDGRTALEYEPAGKAAEESRQIYKTAINLAIKSSGERYGRKTQTA